MVYQSIKRVFCVALLQTGTVPVVVLVQGRSADHGAPGEIQLHPNEKIKRFFDTNLMNMCFKSLLTKTHSDFPPTLVASVELFGFTGHLTTGW